MDENELKTYSQSGWVHFLYVKNYIVDVNKIYESQEKKKVNIENETFKQNSIRLILIKYERKYKYIFQVQLYCHKY